MPPASVEALRAKALLVHDRLCRTYDCPIAYFHNLDPLSELVSSLLSHRTKNADSGRAFKSLRRRFRDWAHVRDAPVREVQEAIAGVTWPEQKAPRIQQVLRLVAEMRGPDMSLDFLGQMSVPDARAWLEHLPGVGPKTSAAVLAFSTLRRPALPVDSHHHRVASRLGLIEPDVSVERSHELLANLVPPEWSAQEVYDHHEVFMLHGQRCCYFHSPACPRCPLLDVCPVGQVRMKLPPHQRESPARQPGREERAQPKDAPAASTPRARRGRRGGKPAQQPPPEQQGFLFPELGD